MSLVLPEMYAEICVSVVALLNHPNIATVHSIEEVEGELFITMEYVEGRPLSAHIPESGLDVDRFLDWFLLLTDALAHAHEQNLVHRDLKPANIMVRKDGTPKILDFGLARFVALGEHAAGMDSEAPTRNVEPRDDNAPPSLTAAGALLGTPAYMSPEQIEGKRVDARTDLFSMGVVMYEALTGKRPFQGATVESIIARILEIDPKPLTALKPVTPYPLWSTIRRCLKKDRELRIPTARILHEELRDVQQEVSSGSVLVDAGAVSPGTAGRSRWGRPAAVASAMLALSLGVLAGLLMDATWSTSPGWRVASAISGTCRWERMRRSRFRFYSRPITTQPLSSRPIHATWSMSRISPDEWRSTSPTFPAARRDTPYVPRGADRSRRGEPSRYHRSRELVPGARRAGVKPETRGVLSSPRPSTPPGRSPLK